MSEICVLHLEEIGKKMTQRFLWLFTHGMEALHKRTVLVLTILFGVCLMVMFVHIFSLQSQLLKVVALTSADVYSRALTEARRLYTTEVVERVQSKQVAARHDYAQFDGAIPLPTTLSRQLGEHMGNHHLGEKARIYSPFPFPWRRNIGGLRDSFEMEAWDYLRIHPQKIFFKFVGVNGQSSLRYATAVIMEPECIQCHNSHPSSPKTDWKVGQVRGVLEITSPMKSYASLSGFDLHNTYGLMGFMALLWLGGLGLVVTKLRRTSTELEHLVAERTAELRATNQQLTLEVQERERAERALQEAHDQLEETVQKRTAKLAESNALLVEEIVERKRAEAGIRALNSDLVQRTTALEASNKELAAFSYSVSHDLRAPLRGIDGFSQAVLEDYGEKLDAQGRSFLGRVRAASQRMSRLIDAMLNLASLTRAEIYLQRVNLSDMAQAVREDLQKSQPERDVIWAITDGLVVMADPQLIRAVLENLLGNAWKFTSQRPDARIEFGLIESEGKSAFYVRDNGAGFDMTYVHKLFGAFQRLHAFSEYPGVGIGLATVHRIIHRHGGEVWAHGAVDQGATFYFTLTSVEGEIS